MQSKETDCRWHSLLVLLVALFALPVHAQPRAEDHAVYRDLYKGRIAEVSQTRDTADDLALIEEMQRAATLIPDSPEVQRLVYRGIMELGASAEAFEQVTAAAQSLAQQFPDDPWAGPSHLIEILDRGYRSSARKDKKTVGTILVDQLNEDAERQSDAGQYAAAMKSYRRSRLVAKDIDSPHFDAIQIAIDRVQQSIRVEAKINGLAQALKQEPDNAAAAREITLLYMIAKADPSAAAKHVQVTQDEQLVQVVQFAVQAMGALKPEQSLVVADWYLEQAEGKQSSLASGYEVDLFSKAVQYYDQTLAQYSARDARVLRITQSRRKANDQLAALQREVAVQDAGEDWIDLIKALDPKGHRIGEQLEKSDGLIKVDTTDFVLPVPAEPSYDLKIKCRFVKGKDGLNFCLPIDGKYVSLTYSRVRHSRTELMDVRIVTDKKQMLRPGQDVEMLIQVRQTRRGEAGVLFKVNGNELIQWQGDTGKLKNNPALLTPEKFKRAIRVSCGGQFIFSKIEYKAMGGSKDD